LSCSASSVKAGVARPGMNYSTLSVQHRCHWSGDSTRARPSIPRHLCAFRRSLPCLWMSFWLIEMTNSTRRGIQEA
jgi:hypothetical protein